MSFLGFTPNNSATVKLLALGRVKIVLIQLTTLLVVACGKIGPAVESLDAIDLLRDWDSTKMASMAEAGVRIEHIQQGPGDLLFVPQGWLTAEASCENEKLIYGMRKSFMISIQLASKEYAAAIPMYKAAGRDVTRLEQILKVLKG